MKQKSLLEKIIAWARERDLLHPDNALSQYLKIGEEIGELCRAILSETPEAQQKEIGDVMVTIFVYSVQAGSLDEDNLSSFDDEMKNFPAQYADGEFMGENNAHYLSMILAEYAEIYHSNESIITLLGKIIEMTIFMGYNPYDCLLLAYESIKDRQGKTENGTFVKETDNEWVSVHTRLPKKQGHYLVKSKSSFPKNCNVVVAEFYEDNQTFYSEAFETPIKDATHWKNI